MSAEIAASRRALELEGKDADRNPRLALMQRHVGDAPRLRDLRRHPYGEYPGLEGWRVHAAHLQRRRAG